MRIGNSSDVTAHGTRIIYVHMKDNERRILGYLDDA